MIKPKFNLRNNPAYKEGSILGSTDVGTKIAPVPLTFTRASKGYVEKASGLTEMGSNLPRIDKDGNTLYEPQRTNLSLHSQNFSNVSWVKDFVSVSANATTAPDGTNTADSVIEDTNNNLHFITQDISSVANAKYALSIYVKANGRTKCLLQTRDIPKWATPKTATFDLEAGSSVGGDIQAVGNGWFRISILATFGGSSAVGGLNIGLLNDIGSALYTGDGVSGIYVWQSQYEPGSYPTSPIKTEGSQVTRVADSSSLTGASAIIGDSEGTIYFEGAFVGNDTNRRIAISDGTFNNFVQFGLNSNNNTQCSINVGGVAQFDIFNNSGFVWGQNSKFAFAYANNDFRVWIDGIPFGSGTSGSTFPNGTLNTLNFARYDGVSNPFTGNVRGLTLYDRALTDSELQELTK